MLTARIRTLIVDDEPLARERLRTLLEKEPDLALIGECANGQEAVARIQNERPDLLFLDVQMPVLDGFGVIEALAPDELPAVVFVTAYDRYALQAFEVHALDYLVKPFDRERFAKALQRARSQVLQGKNAGVSQQLLALLEDVKGKPLKRIVVKSSGRVYFLRMEEIDWIEAAGNYVRLHSGQDCHLLRETMNALEAKLHPDQFARIHRSTIVNLERIKELQPWFHGDYAVILLDGTQLTMSRSYRPKFQEMFGTAL